MKKKLIIFSIVIVTIISMVYLLVLRESVPSDQDLMEGYQKLMDGVVELNEYKLVSQYGSELKLNKPMGITIFKNNLIVSDFGNDRILIIDENGKVKNEIGKTGSREVEFVSPVDVAVDDERNIYVADSGNHRVQVIGENGNFIKEHYIKELSGEPLMNCIEVDKQKNIFVSTSTLERKLSYVYVVSDEGKIKKIGNRLNGILAEWKNKIYFTTTHEIYKTSIVKEFFNQNSAGSGKSYLIEMDSNKILKKYDLPYAYTTKGICCYEDNIYIWSGTRKSVDKYDLNGEYVGTVFKGDKSYLGVHGMTIDNNGRIYLCDSEKSCIYKLEKGD